MKILITGASGSLGEHICNEFANYQDFEVLALYNSNECKYKNIHSLQLNLTDFEKLEEVFKSFKPNIVIHTAALSNTAVCDQSLPKTVYEVNVNATKQIAEFCCTFNARLIYTSTDLVYAGYRGSMLEENSKLIPISLYAETKLMGEEKIKQTFDNYIILRMALMIGFPLTSSGNHFKQMYIDFRSGRPVKLFYDQFRTPLSFFDAAYIIEQLCKLDISNETINVAGKERVSRAQLGRMLCDIAGFDKKLIKKISMEDVPGTYKVADVSLNTDKLQSYGIKIKSLRNSIKNILDNVPLSF